MFHNNDEPKETVTSFSFMVAVLTFCFFLFR